MEGARKQVTICSESTAFNHALRLLLDDHRVDLVSKPVDVAPDTDVVVWRVNEEIPIEDLRVTAAMVPTLVLADENQLIAAVNAGCRGFLPDSASLEEIHRAVMTLLDGGAVVPPHLLGTLLRHMVDRRRQDTEVRSVLDKLTIRELEVFELAAQGARKEEIGERLYISPATARTHLQRVYRKLGVHSQSELMALGMRIGQIDDKESS